MRARAAMSLMKGEKTSWTPITTEKWIKSANKSSAVGIEKIIAEVLGDARIHVKQSQQKAEEKHPSPRQTPTAVTALHRPVSATSNSRLPQQTRLPRSSRKFTTSS